MDIGEKLLSRKEAADYIRAKGLPSSESTLRTYAVTGGGPRFRKFGRAVRYERAELDAWIEAKLTTAVDTTSALRQCAGKGR